jgi:DNA-binding MarR family transcriptional regulator
MTMLFDGEIDKLIHEPARLKIILYLYLVEEADFVYLRNRTSLTKGNLSSHLGKLEQAGYIEIRKTFIEKLPRTIISLSELGRVQFKKYKKTIIDLLESID